MDVGLAEQVCEQLSTNPLNEGRTLYVDSFYTNYNLAHKFLQKKTHVVGTVRSGKKIGQGSACCKPQEGRGNCQRGPERNSIPEMER